MSTYADKTQENKHQAVASEVSQKQSGSESSFHFMDNRPEAIAQRKLQEMVNDRPQARQITGYPSLQQQLIQMVVKRGACSKKNSNLNVYDQNGVIVGHFISKAEFDFDTSESSLATGCIAHKVTDMNRGDFVETDALVGSPFVLSTDVVSRQGMGTYAAELASQSLKAKNTTKRLRDGRKYSEHAVSHVVLAEQAQAAAACYNFAVGSLEAAAEHYEFQQSIPAYVRTKYGGDTGWPLPRDYIETSDYPGVTTARMDTIDELMIAAGMSVDSEVRQNPPFDEGGRKLTEALRLPLQKYILRESGLRPNPDGFWAIGFRGNAWELGSHHAWVQAISPDNNALYMTFDTFPNEENIIASRKRHSDPWQDEGGAVDYIIRITGPTPPQWSLIEQIPDVEFDEILDIDPASEDRSIHPDDDEYEDD